MQAGPGQGGPGHGDPGPGVSWAALDGLPVGVAVYDGERRLVLANAFLRSMLGIAVQTYVPGTHMEEQMRVAAHQGLFGPGDPEAQTAEMLALDYARPHRFRRRLPNGRTFDAHYRPLAGGHTLVCVIETSAGVALREGAELAVARLQATLAGLRVGVAVFGADRTLSSSNPAFASLLGLSAVEVLPGMRFAAVLRAIHDQSGFAGADDEDFVAREDALDRSRPAALRRVRDNGAVVDIASVPLPDDGWTLTVTDITPLAQAEDDARRRAGMLASIVASIPHGVSVYGPDRTLRLVNAAYADIMEGAPVAVGETVEQIVDRRVKAGEFGDSDPAEVAAEQQGHAKSFPMSRRRRRPNGRTIDIRTAPLPDGGHVSVVTDMTAVVEAEAELGRRAEQMEAMLAHIRHGIVLWDKEGRVVASNPVAAEMVGAAADPFAPGRTLDEVVDDAKERGNLGDGPLGETRASRLRVQDRTQKHLDQRLTRNGRILEVRSDPIPHGGFVTTYTDVTQIREAEDALRMAKSAAEAANTAKSRFLAAMSTELRTPLGVVLTELGRLQRVADAGLRTFGAGAVGAGAGVGGTVAAGEVREASVAAAEAARRLLGLIDSVLDMARLEAGRLELVESAADLPQVVRECLRKSDSAAAAAEVALVVDLPEGLPRVRCDAGRLHQALGHVVANAIRFTPALGSVNITARQDWATGDLLLSVEDTGTGIAEEELERVFEPFAQTGDGMRAGLGLYISRTLMRTHGGDLTLRSRVGEGTVALLRLPAARVLGVGGD